MARYRDFVWPFYCKGPWGYKTLCRHRFLLAKITLRTAVVWTISSIYFYTGYTDDLIFMYHILRCPGCRAFTYVDRFQKWKLCPVCGHAYEVAKVPAYLEVEDYHDAEHIIRQMEKHLHANKKKDFTPEESEELRRHYAEWFRKKCH